MRRRVAAACLLVGAACSAPAPILSLPPSPVPRAAVPRSAPRPPRRGAFDSARSHRIVLVVQSVRERVVLEAWCREGVWTTLESVRYRPFVVRETWGRLGRRRPRMLRRVRDQVWEGVVARLRPEPRGGLSLHLEVARAGAGRAVEAGVFEGRPVVLPAPVRYGYRFFCRLGRRTGAVAAWRPGVVVFLGEERPPPAGALTFRCGGGDGFVAGAPAELESFVEEWPAAPPRLEEAGGVLFGDFRLAPVRRASGFRVDAAGVPAAYEDGGLRFRFGRVGRE